MHIGEADFLMVAFPGHTRGHCAIAVRTGTGWLLHCGDVYAYAPQVSPIQPYTHPCGRLTELILTTGFHMPRRHWLTLRSLLQIPDNQVRTVCSHDAIEFMQSKDQAEIR
jgi:glyoxylase-like metal-dependent hydrolase (beta-lactamase superfamily II)